MALSNKERRDRDIYEFVNAKMNERVGDQAKYRYQAILAMAEQKFYLSPDTIADIVRDYQPPTSPDPNQMTAFDLPAEKPRPAR